MVRCVAMPLRREQVSSCPIAGRDIALISRNVADATMQAMQVREQFALTYTAVALGIVRWRQGQALQRSVLI